MIKRKTILKTILSFQNKKTDDNLNNFCINSY